MNKLRNLDTLLFCIRYHTKKHSSAITFIAIYAILWAIATTCLQVQMSHRAKCAFDYIIFLENTLEEETLLDNVYETDAYKDYYNSL